MLRMKTKCNLHTIFKQNRASSETMISSSSVCQNCYTHSRQSRARTHFDFNQNPNCVRQIVLHNRNKFDGSFSLCSFRNGWQRFSRLLRRHFGRRQNVSWPILREKSTLVGMHFVQLINRSERPTTRARREVNEGQMRFVKYHRESFSQLDDECWPDIVNYYT